MKALTAPELAALAGPRLVAVQLVLLGFSTPVGLNSSTWTITYGGVDYKGANGLVSATTIADKASGDVTGIQFMVNGASAEYIALALDGAGEWKGVPVTISTALFDPSSYQIATVLTDWTGRGDTLSIQRQGGACNVVASAESSAVDLLNGTPLTYSDADQQYLHPGDTSFALVVDQAGKPVVWPDRAYFYK